MKSRVRYEEVCEERDQLLATHADVVKERDDAQLEASELRAGVIELESEATRSDYSCDWHS